MKFVIAIVIPILFITTVNHIHRNQHAHTRQLRQLERFSIVAASFRLALRVITPTMKKAGLIGAIGRDSTQTWTTEIEQDSTPSDDGGVEHC